jgi:hypothetical protein
MKTTILCLSCVLLTVTVFGEPPQPYLAGASGQMTRTETLSSEDGMVLTGSERLLTPDAFRPPVEITVVAKTDSTDLRLGYAADQVIFNWGDNRDQLRVDGGPADGHHTSGEGAIPMGKYVTVKWLVTPQHQAIFVNDELRFEHSGDYSNIYKHVTVFSAGGAKVTVKSITVKQLAAHTTMQSADLGDR